MLQCWLNINIGFRALHINDMDASLGFIWQQKDESQHAVPANWGAASIELASKIPSNVMAGIVGARLTLTVIRTLRNCLFVTQAFITICFSSTLGIGRLRTWAIVCVWCVTNFMRSRYAAGRSLPVTDWAAEQRLLSRFYSSGLTWWKSVHIIYFNIQVFGGPNIQGSQNVAKSALQPLWI